MPVDALFLFVFFVHFRLIATVSVGNGVTSGGLVSSRSSDGHDVTMARGLLVAHERDDVRKGEDELAFSASQQVLLLLVHDR